jgi:GMP synthase-like glutamine amidotransferase
MRIHVLQHVAFEGLGSITPYLNQTVHQISYSKFFAKPCLPSLAHIDALIIMGGPMSVHDQAEYPWLSDEKDFVRRFAATGKPMLGICLGAQLIASALGAEVHANPEKEIGWHSIVNSNHGKDQVFQFPNGIEVFHWHGETFSLPHGAIRLAHSQGCAQQAFQLGRHIIGLQFHLETTQKSAKALVSHCAAELVDGRYIQSAAEIMAAAPKRYAAINQLMREVLDYLLAPE